MRKRVRHRVPLFGTKRYLFQFGTAEIEVNPCVQVGGRCQGHAVRLGSKQSVFSFVPQFRRVTSSWDSILQKEL